MIYRISDFENSHKSLVAAINFAVQALDEGDTLELENKVYDIFPDGAFKKYYYISNNDKGEKQIAFPVIGKKNVTIDGRGAKLVFHGDILPFVIDESENVKVKNFSIDYSSPKYAQGKVIEASLKRTVLEYDGDEFNCRVVDGNLSFFSKTDGWENTVEQCLTLEFDADKKAPDPFAPTYFIYTGKPKDHGFLGRMFKDIKARELSENVIELCGNFTREHKVGNYLISTHCGRHYPGIFVADSKDVDLYGIDLLHTYAMGVICQTSENISLEKIVAQAKKDTPRMLCVNADATHFVNCRGKISFKDCKFVNMMDDACNIHGIYLKDPKKVDENAFVAGFGHFQQVGINIFRKGDEVLITNPKNMKEKQVYTVERSVLLSENEIKVFVKEPLCDIPAGYVAENLSSAPDIHVCSCETGNNRPRGFLLATRGKTLVEDSTFYNMYAGVVAGCEMRNWYESGPAADITVRNCNFKNSAYAGGFAMTVVPNLYSPENAGSINGRVLVENNRFELHEKRFLCVRNTAEVTFRNNEYICNTSLPSHPVGNPDGIDVLWCEKTDIEKI